jgi:hypothetical protein
MEIFMTRTFFRQFLIVVMLGIIINIMSFNFLTAEPEENPGKLRKSRIMRSGNDLLIYADPEAHRKGVEEELARMSKPEFIGEINVPDPTIILQGGDNQLITLFRQRNHCRLYGRLPGDVPVRYRRRPRCRILIYPDGGPVYRYIALQRYHV